ncbi:hypothetical protein [uncultured Kordia sp.]|uniref:hypothetical protein n=1 Tax=uncultured Kordia sp. TaxID=507699 RepID=UPI00261C6F8F|nr:hypothetical protein [uncultured Kordia sp.]
MKKQTLKLQLKRQKVSDLNNLRGGKNISDIDSQHGVCDDTNPNRTINATCNAFCTYETWEVFSCGHTNCMGGGTPTQVGETC